MGGEHLHASYIDVAYDGLWLACDHHEIGAQPHGNLTDVMFHADGLGRIGGNQGNGTRQIEEPLVDKSECRRNHGSGVVVGTQPIDVPGPDGVIGTEVATTRAATQDVGSTHTYQHTVVVGGGGSFHGGREFTDADAHFDPHGDFLGGVVVVSGDGDMGVAAELHHVVDTLGDAGFELGFGTDDFVDFGVAPALVLYLWALHEHRSFGWFAALIFAIAGALRLARFNVMIDDPNKPAWSANFFVGMPAPAGAVLVMLPIYLHFGVDMPNDRAYVPFEIAYVLFIAFLMASRIPNFSGKRVGRVPREWFIPVLLGAIAALLLILTYPMQMLIVISLAYLALIPLSVRRFLAYQHADEMAAGQGADGQEAPPSAPAGGH